MNADFPISSLVTRHLSLDQVAGELGVGKRTVERWVKAKELGSFRKDAVRLVSLACLTEFVLGHTTNPARPKWLTAAVEDKFTGKLREIVAAEVHRQAAGAIQERRAA